jgi:hypothetical protein
MKIAYLILTLCLVLLVAGCTSQNAESKESEKLNEIVTVNLTNTTQAVIEDKSPDRIGAEITVDCYSSIPNYEYQKNNIYLFSKETLLGNNSYVTNALYTIPCYPPRKATVLDKFFITYKDSNLSVYQLNFSKGETGYLILNDFQIQEVRFFKKLEQEKKEGWITVKEIEGGGGGNTEPFWITSGRFKVILTYIIKEEDKNYGSLGFVLTRTSDKSVVSVISVKKELMCYNGLCLFGTENYIYEGNDEYYFDVIEANTESWNVVIKQRYEG